MERRSNPILPGAGVPRRRAEDGAGLSYNNDRQNDNGFANHSWTEPFDVGTQSSALLRSRKPLIIASSNANTMKDKTKAQELAHCMHDNGLDIVGVQIHKQVIRTLSLSVGSTINFSFYLQLGGITRRSGSDA